MDAKSYALSKKYTNLVAVGLTSATVDDVNKSITFTLAADGSTHTIHFDQPKDGVSITNISVDANNNLVCTMSDGTEYKSKIDLLDNVYTKTETDTLLLDKAEKNHNHDSAYASKDTEHEHSNKETLDKFGVNDGGKLTFNGDVVTPEAMDLGDYLKKTDAQNTYVEKETGKGLSENDFTTVLKDAYDKAVEDSHTHSNKSIIDKFSEDSDGKLLYDGQSIEADLSTVYKKTETYSQTEADDKFVAKESGKGLSTNDLTDELKSSYDDAVTAKHTHENGTVLDGITAEKVESWDKAEENVQSDWNETDDTADGFIKNKPTIPSLDGYAKTTEIPSKVSQLENDSNYLSSIPEEYVTETELNAKGYLTEHQDISGKVDKVEGKSLISDTEIARLASVDNYDDTDIKAEIAKKADTTAIPSKVSELTNDSNYQTAEQVNSTVTTEIAKVVADAPEDLNTLKEMSDWIAGHENDASAMNSAISDNKTAITTLQTGKADKSEIPTTVAELSDSGDYAKTSDVNDSISALQTDKANTSDLTAHTGDSVIHVTAENKTLWNTVSNKVNKEDGKALLADTDKINYDDAVTKAHTHENKEVLDGITSDKVTAWDNKSEFSGSYNDLNDKPTIDAELSNTSENAIQNKVLTKEINKLYSDISFNDHDTATSGTSFTDAEDGNMIVTDCTRNLLNPTLETTTNNGVTCTRNVDANGKPDGTYTLNGTATDNFNLYLCEPEFTKLTKGEEYRAILYSNILNGLNFDITNNINEGHHSDKIYGYNFICNEDEYPYGCSILIHSGTVFSNVLIKPMLTTDLNATYDDFVPYSGYDIKTCGKNLMSVNDATNGATLDAQVNFNIRIRGLDKGNIASDRIYLLENGVMEGHQSFTFEVTIDEPYGIAIKHNGSTKDIDIEYINYMVRKGTYTISFDVASNNPSVEGGLLLHNIQLEHGDTETDFEPYQDGGTVHIDSTTEFPLLGLKSFDGITNIISPGNVKCVYPTNESGKVITNAINGKQDVLLDTVSGVKAKFTLENGIICVREI